MNIQIYRVSFFDSSFKSTNILLFISSNIAYLRRTDSHSMEQDKDDCSTELLSHPERVELSRCEGGVANIAE